MDQHDRFTLTFDDVMDLDAVGIEELIFGQRASGRKQ